MVRLTINGKARRRHAAGLVSLLLLLCLLVFLLFPFYWTFLTSVKPETELFSSTVTY